MHPHTSSALQVRGTLHSALHQRAGPTPFVFLYLWPQVRDFRYRYKRGGQLWCKMRFLSVRGPGLQFKTPAAVATR